MVCGVDCLCLVQVSAGLNVLLCVVIVGAESLISCGSLNFG